MSLSSDGYKPAMAKLGDEPDWKDNVADAWAAVLSELAGMSWWTSLEEAIGTMQVAIDEVQENVEGGFYDLIFMRQKKIEGRIGPFLLPPLP